MKKNIHTILFIAMAVLPLWACQKSIVNGGEEIVLAVDGGSAVDVETKATAITAIPSTLYWGSTSGTRGNSAETRKYHNGSGAASSATVSSSKISTGKYQTLTPTAYNHYVANQSFTIPATGNVTMTVANNNTDVIAGWTAGTNSATPSVTLNHIFARTGTLTMNTQSTYTISNISWKIVSKGTVSGTAGTYNLSTGAWTAASTTLSEQSFTSSSDLYLIPGTYTIKCTYTLTKGDWTNTFTKSADVTLVAGKVNSITGTASGGAASEIVISLTLSAWGSQTHTPTLG